MICVRMQFQIAQGQAVVHLRPREALAKIIAQHQKAAEAQPRAQAGAAEQISQLRVPRVADVHKNGAANGAEAESAKWKGDDELIDCRETQFMAE